MVWWSWEQWQEEIDRMALWGINLPLAFVGSEWAWRCVVVSCRPSVTLVVVCRPALEPPLTHIFFAA
jgi:hypothetical protein